jgi:PAS domain-containing protein
MRNCKPGTPSWPKPTPTCKTCWRQFNFIPTDIGRPLADIRSNLECQDLPSFIEEAVLRDSVLEKEVRDRDGNWYLMRARPCKTAEGKTDGLVLTLIDISSRKRMGQEREQLLERIEHEQAQLNLVIEQMPAGVVVAEAPSGRVILANRRVEQIMGQPFLPVGHPDEHLRYRGFHPDGRPYAPEDWPLARALRRGEAVTDEQIEYVRGGNQRLNIRASSAPIRDAWGNIVAAVLVIDEITELKILQERLAQAEKLETIGRLAGDALRVHENHPDVISLVITDYGVLPEEANFLPKPFTGAELARKVRELLDSKKHPESWPPYRLRWWFPCTGRNRGRFEYAANHRSF